MDDMVQFLRDRLDEEEQAVRAVPEGRRLYVDPDGCLQLNDPAEKWADGTDHLPNHHSYWMLAYDPACALAEIAVKRRILDRYENQLAVLDNHMGGILTKYLVAELFAVVQLLVAPYSDHPDYFPNWAPPAD